MTETTQRWLIVNGREIKPGADLRGADLRGANLRGADLRGADLRGANLRGANLRGANLWDANLGGADLGGANLGGANLRGANLGGADLWGANLRGANLWGANLRDANLRDANLGGANLGGANLGGANLRGADLWGANLGGANLRGAKNTPTIATAQTRVVPPEGSVIGWKKARTDGGSAIIKLLIPEDAQRSNAFGRKCRASKAVVLEIIGAKIARSDWDPSFVYVVGATVEPSRPFDTEWMEECASGIHFFITREEAEAYHL